jgi:polysaccharide biosynthesis transport protein
MSLASSSPRPSLRGQFVDADIDLASLGSALWRKRYAILRPTIVVALFAFAVVTVIPPKYQSEARVLVVGRDNVFLRPDADKDVIDRGAVDQEAVVSQAQLILSRDLAAEVIAKLKLNELPEFDQAIGGVSLLKTLLSVFGITRNPMAMTAQERVLEAYYDRLSVFPVEKSHVIVIDFLSENPELAARVANAIADGYLKRQQEAKQEQARSASTWLSGEIETMRRKVADAEAKVEAFRAKSNLLVGPNNTTLSLQQLGDLNGQLAAARAQKSDAQAKARLIRDMLKSGEPLESSDILNSELVRRLSEQRVTLRAQFAEQSSSLLGNHPRIKELRAQIADLDIEIRKEAEALARSLENDAKLADAKVAAQVSAFDQLKSQAVTSNEDDVQLRALDRDAKSQRDLLESYLAKYREATARDTIASAPADARVISRATVSNVPAYPKKLPTVLIASLAALVLSSGLVLTRELLASPAAGAMAAPRSSGRQFGFGRRAGSDVGNDTGAGARTGAKVAAAAERAEENYASSPRSLSARLRAVVQASRGTQGSQAAQGIDEQAMFDAPQTFDAQEPMPVGVPVSAIEEFARNLHHVGVAGSQMAFFAAASDLDSGGVAIRFARALAQTGQHDARVVLVGLGASDLAIREISSDPSAPGLAELAAGTASFADIITKDSASGLNLITAGEGAEHSALLAAPGMSRNFTALAHAYPHLVIDAGFVGGPNMPALARVAPHAVLLVETASGQATAKARDALLAAGFDNVTLLIADRGATVAPLAAAAA